VPPPAVEFWERSESLSFLSGARATLRSKPWCATMYAAIRGTAARHRQKLPGSDTHFCQKASSLARVPARTLRTDYVPVEQATAAIGYLRNSKRRATLPAEVSGEARVETHWLSLEKSSVAYYKKFILAGANQQLDFVSDEGRPIFMAHLSPGKICDDCRVPRRLTSWNTELLPRSHRNSSSLHSSHSCPPSSHCINQQRIFVDVDGIRWGPNVRTCKTGPLKNCRRPGIRTICLAR